MKKLIEGCTNDPMFRPADVSSFRSLEIQQWRVNLSSRAVAHRYEQVVEGLDKALRNEEKADPQIIPEIRKSIKDATEFALQGHFVTA